MNIGQRGVLVANPKTCELALHAAKNQYHPKSCVKTLPVNWRLYDAIEYVKENQVVCASVVEGYSLHA